jgi:hypothetical protein
MTAQVRDEEFLEPLEKKFDTRVHIRNPKTGQIVRVQPYKLVIRDGQQRFFRDGLEFYPNGDPVDPAAYMKKKGGKTSPQHSSNAFADNDRKYMAPLEDELNQFKVGMMKELSEFKNAIFSAIKEEVIPLVAALKADKEKVDAQKVVKATEEKKTESKATPIRPDGQGAKEAK